MLRHWVLIAACMLSPVAASAQSGAAPTTTTSAAAPYSRPVETLQIGGARAGLMQSGAAVGGYSVLYQTSQMRTSLFTQTRTRLTNNFHFNGTDGADLLTGRCVLRSEGRSLLGVDWNQHTTQVYGCEIVNQPDGQYDLEVALPAFRESHFGIGGLSISGGDDFNSDEQHAILRAKMVYEDVSYEATPTGFGPVPMMGPRVVEGFVITRDGAPVGRVDFVRGSPKSGAITAPVADADGRRAVLFMALNLLLMPDLYAPYVRNQVLGR